jgi:hypothetical protein
VLLICFALHCTHARASPENRGKDEIFVPAQVKDEHGTSTSFYCKFFQVGSRCTGPISDPVLTPYASLYSYTTINSLEQV